MATLFQPLNPDEVCIHGTSDLLHALRLALKTTCQSYPVSDQLNALMTLNDAKIMGMGLPPTQRDALTQLLTDKYTQPVRSYHG